jgi:hypothetical protein
MGGESMNNKKVVEYSNEYYAAAIRFNDIIMEVARKYGVDKHRIETYIDSWVANEGTVLEYHVQHFDVYIDGERIGAVEFGFDYSDDVDEMTGNSVVSLYSDKSIYEQSEKMFKEYVKEEVEA